MVSKFSPSKWEKNRKKERHLKTGKWKCGVIKFMHGEEATKYLVNRYGRHIN